MSPVTVDASAVIAPQVMNEWKSAFGGMADIVFHQAYALFSRANLWIELPQRPAVNAGAKMNAVNVRPSN